MPSVSSLQEASELFADANGHGRHLRIGKDVTTDGLDRILEHEAGDLTCTVEAGIRLSELNAELARHGQRLSVDPPGDPTIGALLARNLSGPLRHAFGAPRDLVLGVTLVLADGTIASAGGKVVKNVAGYDLARLVCGSSGELALIARVSFRLHPMPKSARTLAFETDDAAASVAVLLRSHLQPGALDVLHPGRVAVLFEGSARAVDEQVDATEHLIDGLAGHVATTGDNTVWEESRRRQQEAPGRVRFEPGRLEETLAGLDRALVRPSAGVAFVPFEASEELPESVRRLHESIRAVFDPNGVLS